MGPANPRDGASLQKKATGLFKTGCYLYMGGFGIKCFPGYYS